MMNQKRKIDPPKAHGPVHHVLFYLPDENKYTVISTASTLFPKDVDLENLAPLTRIELKDRLVKFPALYVCSSTIASEIEIRQKRLQQRIDEGLHLNAESSLNFLNESFELPHVDGSRNDSTVSEMDNVESGSVENVGDGAASVSEGSQGDENATTNKLLLLLVEEQRKTNDILNSIKADAAKFNKRLLKRFSAGSAQLYQPESSGGLHEINPVMFGDVDLARAGSRSFDASAFALCVSRVLWSDEELAHGRLFPKRSKGRPPLSPTRSKLFQNAICSRFNCEVFDEKMEVATAAVNQLGTDISSGKRKRASTD